MLILLLKVFFLCLKIGIFLVYGANNLWRRIISGGTYSPGHMFSGRIVSGGGYSPGRIISGHMFSGQIFSGADVLGAHIPSTENDVALIPPVVPVAPTYNQIEDRVTPGDQAVRRSTRVPKPSTRYPAEEFNTS